MTFSYDDVRRLASDPESDWDTLHRIAEEYPELRPAVASNPSTYPELLEALADLDDPAITAALMRRFNPEAAAAAETDAGSQEPSPTEQPPEARAPEHPEDDAQEIDPRAADPAGSEVTSDTTSEATSEATPAGPETGEAAGAATPPPATPTPATPTRTVQVSGETGAAAAAGASAGATGSTAHAADPAVGTRDDAEEPPPAMQASTLVGAAGAGISAQALQERARRRRSRLGLIALAVVLPIIALVAIGALVMMLLGDRGDPQAEPDGAAASESAVSESPAETSPSPSAEPSPSPSPSPTGPSLQELRAAVAELPQSSTCDDVTDDVDVFTAYAELAAEEGSWSAEDDQLVQQTVEDLQAECGALQSAQVHQQLGDQSAAGLAAAAEDMGTGWIETGYDAPEDAAELTSFMMPSGNIRCEMGDRLRCTIVEHDFAAPESCEGTDVTTYESTLRTAARPDCEEPVQEAERQILAYGQTTANEYFACRSMRSGISCWNQISGAGFDLARDDQNTY